MAAPPTSTLAQWATAAYAVVVAPLSSRVLRGWTPGVPPPAGEVNFVYKHITGWIENLTLHAGYFSTVEEALDGLAVDGVGWIDEYDRDDRPLSVNVGIDNGGANNALDFAGKYVVVGTAANAVERRLRSDLTLDGSYTLSSPSTITRIKSDGEIVLVAHGSRVAAFPVEGASPVAETWSYDHGGNVYDVYIGRTYVYLVGAAGTGTHHVRALNRSSGAVVWSYDHGAPVWGVEGDGYRLFIAGEYSSHSSGASLRCLYAATGADALNEGGTSADTTKTAYDVVTAAEFSLPGCLAADGRALYCAFNGTDPYQIEKRSAVDGRLVQGIALDGPVASIVCDDEYVFANVSHTLSGYAEILKLRKEDLAGGDRGLNVVASVYERILDVATDGYAVAVALPDDGGDTLARLYRGNSTPRQVRRVDPSATTNLPYRRPFLPLR